MSSSVYRILPTSLKKALLVVARALACRAGQRSGREAHIELKHDALRDLDKTVGRGSRRHIVLDAGHTRRVAALGEHVHDHLREDAGVKARVQRVLRLDAELRDAAEGRHAARGHDARAHKVDSGRKLGRKPRLVAVEAEDEPVARVEAQGACAGHVVDGGVGRCRQLARRLVAELHLYLLLHRLERALGIDDREVEVIAKRDEGVAMCVENSVALFDERAVEIRIALRHNGGVRVRALAHAAVVLAGAQAAALLPAHALLAAHVQNAHEEARGRRVLHACRVQRAHLVAEQGQRLHLRGRSREAVDKRACAMHGLEELEQERLEHRLVVHQAARGNAVAGLRHARRQQLGYHDGVVGVAAQTHHEARVLRLARARRAVEPYDLPREHEGEAALLQACPHGVKRVTRVATMLGCVALRRRQVACLKNLGLRVHTLALSQHAQAARWQSTVRAQRRCRARQHMRRGPRWKRRRRLLKRQEMGRVEHISARVTHVRRP
eukprot:IDg13962t1